MGTLKQDVKHHSDWLVKAFREDRINLDYSIKSLIEIDRFFNKHAVKGQAVKGGRLSKNLGPVLFSIASYVGDCLIKTVPGSDWVTDDKDPEGEINISVVFPNGGTVWPMQRVMKRFKLGSEESIYVYGHMLTKEFTKEEFDSSYWELKGESGKWWKFWK
ncbi:MAG: hypothetical protein JST50_10080 [Bacteroidetes bacterium]|jgi:hypothetical protein|nr:hypothetical protein [Bacteroidota bacterium]